MAQAGRIPSDLTTLIGRVREIRDVRATIGRARLVSLTGPGGVGKSRIAAQTARTVERTFADGVRYIDLAAVGDPTLVASAFAAVLDGSAPAGARLAERLRHWQALLVVDNCEHVVAECADTIDEILREAPDIRALVTSRERLGVNGEHVLRVDPLPVPAEDEVDPDGLVQRNEAVALLVDRARAVQPRFAVTPGNLADVVRLTRRLDGLPLAIELAAARMSTMSVGQIADNLSNPDRILRTPGRAGSDRHASLRDTLQWSYELCSAPEQALWSAMSIFAGPVTAATVAAVCTDDPDLGEEDVEDLLEGLVRKSILLCDPRNRPTFRMLDAVRHFGRTRIPAEAAAALAGRHAAHFREVAARAAVEWAGPGQVEVAALLQTALPDLRIAMEALLIGPDRHLGAAVVADLYPLWVCLGRQREGEIWLGRALEGHSRPSARLLWCAGWVQMISGRIGPARGLLDRAALAAIAEGRTNDQLIAAALAAVIAMFDASIRVEVALGSAAVVGLADSTDPHGGAIALMCLAELLIVSGRLEQALEYCLASQRLCLHLGESWCLSCVLWVRSLALLLDGRFGEAEAAALESLRLKVELDDPAGIILACEILAWAAAGQGRWADAARLDIAIGRQAGRNFTPLSEFTRLSELRESWSARIVAGFGPEPYEELAASLAAAPPAVVASLAFNRSAPASTARRSDSVVDGLLTQRETEVAELVAGGLSNRQIAARLVISTRTAEVHVGRILAKLGCAHRSQVAAWWHEQLPIS